MAGNKTAPLQTEFEFTLPKGYLDAEGNLHCQGAMRMATAMDEIAPLRDVRVKNNQAYLTLAILARVVTRLGQVKEITPDVMEGLFTADVTFLQDFYHQINGNGASLVTATCPKCDHVFEMEATHVGG